jgi:hypothetical protein
MDCGEAVIGPHDICDGAVCQNLYRTERRFHVFQAVLFRNKYIVWLERYESVSTIEILLHRSLLYTGPYPRTLYNKSRCSKISIMETLSWLSSSRIILLQQKAA